MAKSKSRKKSKPETDIFINARKRRKNRILIESLLGAIEDVLGDNEKIRTLAKELREHIAAHLPLPINSVLSMKDQKIPLPEMLEAMVAEAREIKKSVLEEQAAKHHVPAETPKQQ